MSKRSFNRATGAVAIALAIFVVGACSSDDDKTTTTDDKTTTTKDTSDSSSEESQEQRAVFDKSIQSQLIAVGCYSGEADGIIGPKTDAAIVQFQTDSSLAADGELGPKTEKALSEAAAAKKTVCVAAPVTPVKPANTPGTPSCTAVSLSEGIGGDPSTTLSSYVCSGDYAGILVTGDSKGSVLEWSTTGEYPGWTQLDFETVCNETNDIPTSVKQIGCTGNGDAGDPGAGAADTSTP